MIALNFSAETFEQVAAQVIAAAAALQQKNASATAAPAPSEPSPNGPSEHGETDAANLDTTGAPKKRGRKLKSETPSAGDGIAPLAQANPHPDIPGSDAVKSEHPTPAPAVSTPVIEKSALVDALSKVHTAKGMTGARGVLARFGVGRIGDLDVKRYPEFLEVCQKEIA